jgi:thymidine kinase
VDRRIDDRAASGTIASRIGLRAPAVPFEPATDVHRAITKRHADVPLSCVLVDEAQFLTREQVFQLARVCDELRVPVLCYGLRTDFRAELFEGSRHLLAIADVLVELKAVCECGAKATMNLRVDETGEAVRDGAQTEIGGNDRYVALCRRHFMERSGV